MSNLTSHSCLPCLSGPPWPSGLPFPLVLHSVPGCHRFHSYWCPSSTADQDCLAHVSFTTVDLMTPAGIRLGSCLEAVCFLAFWEVSLSLGRDKLYREVAAEAPECTIWPTTSFLIEVLALIKPSLPADRKLQEGVVHLRTTAL